MLLEQSLLFGLSKRNAVNALYDSLHEVIYQKMVIQVEPLTSAEKSHFFPLHRVGPAQTNPSHNCNNHSNVGRNWVW